MERQTGLEAVGQILPAADRPLSHEEQNELRLLEIRERAFSGHYTEADAREAERLLYC